MKDLLAPAARWLSRLSPRTAYLLALCCAFAIGVADFSSDPGVSFSLGYVIVIGFAAWACGALPALVLAIFPAAVMAWEDWSVFGHGAPAIMAWNGFSRLALYVLVSWGCAALAQTNRRHRAAAEERTAAWKAEAEQHQATTGRLRETVERFEQVINNITEVFWLTNPEKTEMIFISPGYERIWGRTREALRSNPESWLDALHPDDRADITRRAKTEQTSASYDVEYRIIRPDGTLRWIRDRAFPVRNPAGEIYRVAGIAEDITEHKRMTGALAEANELTRAILDASPAGIAAWKATGECVMANDAMARILGGTTEAILKQNFRQLESWKRHGMLEQVDTVLRTKKPLATDYHGFSSFGRELFLRFQMAYCTVKGEPHVLIVLNDVSEQVRAEAALRESENRLRAAINGAPIALFATDEQGVITFEDGRALRDASGDLAGHIGRPAREVYAAHPDLVANLDRVLRGEEFSAPVRLGETIMECYYSPKRDVAGRLIGFTGVGTNITERVQLERQILEITDREQARIGQDIHDGLCQELVGIAFDASQLQNALLTRGVPEAARAKRMATELDNAITKARQVARGLFPIRMEGEGVTSALEELLNSVHERWNLDCHLELSGDVQIPPGGIATHLYRIAHEAVNNAVKHSEGKQILIRLASDNGLIQLEIEDDGKGFSSSRPDGDGGMGLSIMEYRARTIGAALEVKPRPGGGTIVSCRL